MSRFVFAGLAAVLMAAGPVAETIDLDRCIGGKCHRNGRYDSVQIEESVFVVYIDADRCPGQDVHCPTSYEAFTAPDGTPLDTGGYRPGERTRGTIKVYVPRQYKGLYVKGINGSKRDDFLPLTDLEDYRRARDVEIRQVAVETGIDALFDRLVEAYAAGDADLAASAYAEDAAYMRPQVDVIRGRAAIRESFARRFESAGSDGEQLALSFEHGERVVEGRLAYATGTLELTRRGPAGERSSRGAFLVILRFAEGRGWRFQVDSSTPAP